MGAIRLRLAPLLTAAQARARDRHTIDAIGVPGFVLMEHAGRAVADVVCERLTTHRSTAPATVLVVCGAGNNGGDGYVCARHLLARGVDVTVVSTVDVATLKGDAHTAASLFEKTAAHLGHPGTQTGDVKSRVSQSTPTVIVDALFGTGLSRPLDEEATSVVVAIDTVRQRGAVVVAVDVPSGVLADGQASDVCVRADVTVTFGGRKVAHHSEPGRAFCGEVKDVDLGFIPPPDERLDVWRVTGVTLPAVDVTAHKGRFGHVGVVAGSPGMGGASVLSSIAALRAGAGLVSLVGDVDVARPVEVMSVAPSGDLASLDALVVGPGLAAHEADDVRAFVRHQRKDANAHERTLWTVADAGALTMLDKGDAEVWTPHPGEAARMLGVSVSDVQRDRIAAAHKIAFLKGGVVVLKGHAPVVATGSRVFVVDGDAPALAVAGSGDVLAGIIGAGLGGAFGPGTVDAVVVASVYMHQRAGADISRGALAAEIALRVRDVVESARGA